MRVEQSTDGDIIDSVAPVEKYCKSLFGVLLLEPGKICMPVRASSYDLRRERFVPPGPGQPLEVPRESAQNARRRMITVAVTKR